MLKSQLNLVPPTYVGSFPHDSQSYARGWEPIITQVVQTRKEGGVYTCYGQVLVKCSEDFCGGFEIRSCLVSHTMATFSESWGWSGNIFGQYPSKDAKDPYAAFPGLDKAFHVQDDDADLEDLVYTALAIRVLAKSLYDNRAGIFGRDKRGGRVHKLIERITQVGNWSNWSHSGHFNTEWDWQNKVEAVCYAFEDSLPRENATIGFYNVNSGNTVGIYASVARSEDLYDDDISDFLITRYTDADKHQQLARKGLMQQCPKEEWYCG